VQPDNHFVLISILSIVDPTYIMQKNDMFFVVCWLREFDSMNIIFIERFYNAK
jgi:uncharacterized membrane protein